MVTAVNVTHTHVCARTHTPAVRDIERMLTVVSVTHTDHTHAHTRTHTHTYTQTHTHARMHAHTHIHTYIQTYVHSVYVL